MKTNTGLIFQPHEDAYVAAVNERATKVGEHQMAIGQLTDQYITQCGGTQYGERSLGRIAQHPELACSVMEITRCWNLYRLSHQYGDLLSDAKLGLSVKYELARVMPKAMPDGEKRELLAELVKEAHGQTVTEVAKLVSDRLRARGQLREAKTKPPTVADAELLPTNPVVTATPRPSGIDFLAAADTLAQLGKTDPAQLLEPGDLRQLVIRGLPPLTDAVEAVAEAGMDEELAMMVAAMGQRLTAAAATRRRQQDSSLRLLAPGEETGQTAAIPVNPPEQNGNEFDVISGEVYPAVFRCVRHDSEERYWELVFDIPAPEGRFSVYGRISKLQTLKRWAGVLGAGNGEVSGADIVAALDRHRDQSCQVRMTTGDKPWPVVGDILPEPMAEAV